MNVSGVPLTIPVVPITPSAALRWKRIMGADPAQHSAYVAVTAKRSDDWAHLASRVLEESIRGR